MMLNIKSFEAIEKEKKTKKNDAQQIYALTLPKGARENKK